MPNHTNLVSFSEAAREKDCSRTTLYRAANDGRIKAVTVGDRRMLVQDADYEAFEPRWKGGRVRKLDEQDGA